MLLGKVANIDVWCWSLFKTWVIILIDFLSIDMEVSWCLIFERWKSTAITETFFVDLDHVKFPFVDPAIGKVEVLVNIIWLEVWITWKALFRHLNLFIATVQGYTNAIYWIDRVSKTTRVSDVRLSYWAICLNSKEKVLAPFGLDRVNHVATSTV